MTLQRLIGYLRFLIAGGINTLFGFALYSALVLVWGRPELSLALASLAGVAFNFYSYKKIGFGHKGANRYVSFVLVYAIIFTLNLALLSFLKGQIVPLVADAWGLRPAYILAQFCALMLVVPISYVLMKRFVYPPSPIEGS